jgi:hypothetical protein
MSRILHLHRSNPHSVNSPRAAGTVRARSMQAPRKDSSRLTRRKRDSLASSRLAASLPARRSTTRIRSGCARPGKNPRSGVRREPRE